MHSDGKWECLSESESDYDPDPMETEDADRIVLVQHRQQTSTITEDPTSEWLAPDPTTADKSADLLLVTDSDPENEPAVATKTQRKNRPRMTSRSWSIVPWLLTIVMLLALGVLSAILIIF